ncbi:hypothetical protein NS334_01905 [Sphingomonas endophytica]|uniref:Uncharacterized protein n=2 Tax=Sphingomonas endophytica TaxID=869719 RepID=A0A147I9B4_9SPHN|nr:hypothetical protein NS334_01905 [Sphingomonas endophytica]
MAGAALALAAAPAPAVARTPSLLWRDVTSLGVTCQIHTANGIDDGALTRRLCDAVRARAARGAPVPVVAAPLGGAALAAGRVTLLVQGDVAAVRGAPVLALTIRPFRNSAEGQQFFTAPPRAVALDDRAALEAAVDAMLANTLPWQAGASPRARRIPDPSQP